MKANPRLLWGEKWQIVTIVKKTMENLTWDEKTQKFKGTIDLQKSIPEITHLKNAYEKLRLNQWNFKNEETCNRCNYWRSEKISKNQKKTMTEILVVPNNKAIQPFIAVLNTYGIKPEEYVELLNKKGGFYEQMTGGKGAGMHYLLKKIKTYEIKPKH